MLASGDAIIALICKHYGIDTILTFDEGFKRIPWLRSYPRSPSEPSWSDIISMKLHIVIIKTERVLVTPSVLAAVILHAWIYDGFRVPAGRPAGISAQDSSAPKAGTYKEMSQKLILIWGKSDKDSYLII